MAEPVDAGGWEQALLPQGREALARAGGAALRTGSQGEWRELQTNPERLQ